MGGGEEDLYPRGLISGLKSKICFKMKLIRTISKYDFVSLLVIIKLLNDI